ncbi:hypothetical protein SMICM304S_04382 [Streptomyces microflavus]
MHRGSAKSNIGHAQAASGVIGVIKMVLALQHEWLPRTLHAEKPNTRIDWTGGELELLRKPRRWPWTRRVRRAGISSFGISGTNTHVIIEEALVTVVADRPGDDILVHPLVLSGTDAAALRAQAQHWAEWLDARPAASMRDIAYTSAVGRTHFDARAVVFASNTLDAAEALRAVEPSSGTALGEMAFVFGGQDAQPPGMNSQLLEQSAVFRETVAECDAALSPLTGWSVLKVLRGEEDVSGPDVLPCTLFATYLWTRGAVAQLGCGARGGGGRRAGRGRRRRGERGVDLGGRRPRHRPSGSRALGGRGRRCDAGDCPCPDFHPLLLSPDGRGRAGPGARRRLLGPRPAGAGAQGARPCAGTAAR